MLALNPGLSNEEQWCLMCRFTGAESSQEDGPMKRPLSPSSIRNEPYPTPDGLDLEWSDFDVMNDVQGGVSFLGVYVDF